MTLLTYRIDGREGLIMATDDEYAAVETADCPECGYTTLRKIKSGDMFSHRIRGEKGQPVCPASESMKRNPWELRRES